MSGADGGGAGSRKEERPGGGGLRRGGGSRLTGPRRREAAARLAAERTKRPGVAEEVGGFGALFDLAAAGWQDPAAGGGLRRGSGPSSSLQARGKKRGAPARPVLRGESAGGAGERRRRRRREPCLRRCPSRLPRRRARSGRHVRQRPRDKGGRGALLPRLPRSPPGAWKGRGTPHSSPGSANPAGRQGPGSSAARRRSSRGSIRAATSTLPASLSGRWSASASCRRPSASAPATASGPCPPPASMPTASRSSAASCRHPPCRSSPPLPLRAAAKRQARRRARRTRSGAPCSPRHPSSPGPCAHLQQADGSGPHHRRRGSRQPSPRLASRDGRAHRSRRRPAPAGACLVAGGGRRSRDGGCGASSTAAWA